MVLKSLNWLSVVLGTALWCIGIYIYIHNKKILHNDLKSDNIVLDKEEREEISYFPILVDFCKARNMSAVPKKQLTESEKKMYKKDISTLHLKL